MRLREIKPGMRIHCNTKAEWCQLEEILTQEGYIGCSYFVTLKNDCYVEIKENKKHVWGHIVNEKCIEFSDLIIPELSAEEVLNICHQICEEQNGCENCFCEKDCFADRSTDARKIIEICEQWKADHEKKEPELEWVNVCRIIQVKSNGVKQCVYEEDLASGLTDAEIKVMVEAILKRYISMYDGNYIAVVERVCRVKKGD